MNSHTYDYDYIDGNAAAGELSNIFAMDVTVAEGQCAHCGATKRFAEAHLYMQAPGVVARCAVCEHVLLRFVKARQRAFLDLRGMTCLILDTSLSKSVNAKSYAAFCARMTMFLLATRQIETHRSNATSQRNEGLKGAVLTFETRGNNRPVCESWQFKARNCNPSKSPL